MTHLSTTDLMAMNARGAVVALAAEIELTLRLIDQLPSDAPTAEDVRNLRRTLEFRTAQVQREVQAVEGALAGVVGAALLSAERAVRP